MKLNCFSLFFVPTLPYWQRSIGPRRAFASSPSGAYSRVLNSPSGAYSRVLKKTKGQKNEKKGKQVKKEKKETVRDSPPACGTDFFVGTWEYTGGCGGDAYRLVIACDDDDRECTYTEKKIVNGIYDDSVCGYSGKFDPSEKIYFDRQSQICHIGYVALGKKFCPEGNFKTVDFGFSAHKSLHVEKPMSILFSKDGGLSFYNQETPRQATKVSSTGLRWLQEANNITLPLNGTGSNNTDGCKVEVCTAVGHYYETKVKNKQNDICDESRAQCGRDNPNNICKEYDCFDLLGNTIKCCDGSGDRIRKACFCNVVGSYYDKITREQKDLCRNQCGRDNKENLCLKHDCFDLSSPHRHINCCDLSTDGLIEKKCFNSK